MSAVVPGHIQIIDPAGGETFGCRKWRAQSARELTEYIDTGILPRTWRYPSGTVFYSAGENRIIAEEILRGRGWGKRAGLRISRTSLQVHHHVSNNGGAEAFVAKHSSPNTET